VIGLWSIQLTELKGVLEVGEVLSLRSTYTENTLINR